MVVMTPRVRGIVLVVALTLAASLLTLAVVLAKPAQAQAQTVTSTDKTPISQYYYSSCSNEYVFVEGTLHTVGHTTIDANGAYHTEFHFNLKGQGEGLDSSTLEPTGAKYVINETFGYHINYPLAPVDNFNETFAETFKITRQGSDSTTDDQQVKVLIHYTVNANGEVTAEVEKLEGVECK